MAKYFLMQSGKIAAEMPGDEKELAALIDPNALPVHIAVIMDGNGRWARKRCLPRVAGHRAGIQSVRDILEASADLGIGVLTLYAFSTENWKRPLAEVRTLMDLLREYLAREIDNLDRNNIRFGTIGDRSALGDVVRNDLEQAIRRTSENTGLRFNVALNYSGRAELRQAVDAILSEARENPRLFDGVTEEDIARHLYTSDLPDPDLLIRTSGELRVSNFMLWQIAYSEFWVTPTLWPDFRRRHLYEAIVDFQKRERRYGGLAPALAR
jgi:undecaprenyl diphosphate synthase